jgi:hypothetical protein
VVVWGLSIVGKGGYTYPPDLELKGRPQFPQDLPRQMLCLRSSRPTEAISAAVGSRTKVIDMFNLLGKRAGHRTVSVLDLGQVGRMATGRPRHPGHGEPSGLAVTDGPASQFVERRQHNIYRDS